jgi:hypothetical protein
MKKVWIAHATTVNGDHNLYAFTKEPSFKQIAKKVWEDEGKCESLKFYLTYLSCDIKEVEVET